MSVRVPPARPFDAGPARGFNTVYRWAEHTGELELRIEAPSEAAVFAEALAAFSELAGDGEGPSSAEREIVLVGEDRELLLAEWLNELVYLADADGFVPDRVTELALEPGGLHGRVRGHDGEPVPLVKAASLHRLEYGKTDGAWHARVVLDV
jgi:SHS2 domain-containing protein